MGQSLVKNYIHLVFSTKYRKPLIQPPVEQQLYAYLGGLCQQLGCTVITVGGHKDHVHLLFMLDKKVALSEFVKKLKANSSKWMKTRDSALRSFQWQNGYGAFSVNPRQVERVSLYIRNQHEHHQRKTFQEEFHTFLRQYEVTFDERYLWE
jgi:putative transposase